TSSRPSRFVGPSSGQAYDTLGEFLRNYQGYDSAEAGRKRIQAGAGNIRGAILTLSDYSLSTIENSCFSWQFAERLPRLESEKNAGSRISRGIGPTGKSESAVRGLSHDRTTLATLVEALAL